MRLALILCTLSAALCLASGLSTTETPTKASGYPKKVTTLKKRPTKTPSTPLPPALTATTTTSKPSKLRVKSVQRATTARPKLTTTASPQLPDNFKNLPADDLEFIKELDKQFKLHGDKIKIKVERDNSTGKTIKRTIDGELGYGYAHQGYDYTPPKFMFYPYSQHDIPGTESPDYAAYSPAGYEQSHVTSVTIEPSYSYELKPQTSYETQAAPEPALHQEQAQLDLPHASGGHESTGQEADYQEPVIVLRIPGPAKYASHLQTLLQQYLEIRAAQYLQLLEQAELRKQQHQQPQSHHAEQSYANADAQQQSHYPEVSYAHQLAPTPQPIQYAAIDDVYQSYKGRHQQQQQEVQYDQQPPAEAYYEPAAYQAPPQFYYAQPAQEAQHQQQQQPHYEGAYQPHLYLIAMSPQSMHYHEQSLPAAPQPIYVPESDAHTVPVAEEPHGESHDLPITENNPRPTHTKVVFKPHGSHTGAADFAANMYTLPSIRPYERHDEQQQQQHEQHQHHQQQQQQQQPQAESVDAASADYQPAADADAVAITQRPYNYHAHGLQTVRMRQGGTAKRGAMPTPAADGADQQLQQIRDYVRDKLGAEMGSAMEYKTTQLLEG